MMTAPLSAEEVRERLPGRKSLSFEKYLFFSSKVLEKFIKKPIYSHSMTLISVMKFNPKEGAMVSDEETSNYARKYDTADKAHEFSNSKGTILFGGAGTRDFLYEISSSLPAEFENLEEGITSGYHFACILSKKMSEVKRRYLRGHFFDMYGLSEEELQTGRKMIEDKGLPLEPSLLQEYQKAIKGEDPRTQPIVNNGFLALVYTTKEGIRLYSIGSWGNPVPIAGNSGCIGSGADMADGEIAAFFENIPREKRKQIDRIEGISTLLYATERAGTRNVGVGGTPAIKIIENGNILTPTEDNSKLAVEIIKGEKRGYLSQKFRRKALEDLLYKNEGFATVEKEMWAKTTNKEELNLMLRGYKR